jgi:hypothetical protein
VHSGSEKLKSRRTAWDYIGYGLLGALGLGLILLVIVMFIPIQDAPLADAPTLWIDEVKRGDMVVQVLGFGTITRARGKTAATAVIEILDSYTDEVKLGQTVEIHTRPAIARAHVSGIDEASVNGVHKVKITLDGAVPDGVTDGAQVDGTITIETLRNVVYMGRPVHGEQNSTVTIFKVTPDGKAANRVSIKLGRASVNAIEILEGLKPGDRVILSDMSMWDAVDHVEIK